MATILIVDDSRTVALMFQRYFEGIGHSVFVANDGPAGLELARSTPPDLVVLDRILPKMDGLEVCRTLRLEHSHRVMKVLMVTGSEDAELRRKSDEAGVDMLLTKECGFASMLDVASQLLEPNIVP